MRKRSAPPWARGGHRAGRLVEVPTPDLVVARLAGWPVLPGEAAGARLQQTEAMLASYRANHIKGPRMPVRPGGAPVARAAPRRCPRAGQRAVFALASWLNLRYFSRRQNAILGCSIRHSLATPKAPILEPFSRSDRGPAPECQSHQWHRFPARLTICARPRCRGHLPGRGGRVRKRARVGRVRDPEIVFARIEHADPLPGRQWHSARLPDPAAADAPAPRRD